jgi:hypothetical protein
MKRIYNLLFHKHVQPAFSQFLLLTTLATTGLLYTSCTKVYAETVSVKEPELTKYVEVASAIEKERQKDFAIIKQMIGNAEIPQIVCNDPKSFNSLSEQPKNIAVNYCNFSQKIVKDSGFTIERFNQILIESKNNEELKKLIYEKSKQLQQKP